MKVNFADTFFSSFKRMVNREKWYWKTWDFVRYDFPNFCSNVWKFRKALWKHHWWDHHGTLEFMKIGISDMAENTAEKGNEVEASLNKKVEAMRRVVQLIENYNQDRYIEMAEAELGEMAPFEFKFEEVEGSDELYELVDTETPEEKDHSRKVFQRAREIEASEWEEIWKILKGQDMKEYEQLSKNLTHEEHIKMDHYYKWFDGSGMRGWWD